MSGSTRNDSKRFTDKLEQYLHYTALDMDEKEMACKLNVSQSAIYNRLTRIMDITGLLTRDEVIQYAKERADEQGVYRQTKGIPALPSSRSQ